MRGLSSTQALEAAAKQQHGMVAPRPALHSSSCPPQAHEKFYEVVFSSEVQFLSVWLTLAGALGMPTARYCRPGIGSHLLRVLPASLSLRPCLDGRAHLCAAVLSRPLRPNESTGNVVEMLQLDAEVERSLWRRKRLCRSASERRASVRCALRSLFDSNSRRVRRELGLCNNIARVRFIYCKVT